MMMPHTELAPLCTVLIVDDVPENLAVLHDALDEAGYAVLVATHGEAALQSVSKFTPDVILLDAVMPGMDGFEVCRRLRAQDTARTVPVIFMTGLTESEHVVAGFAAGGTDYVTKPVRPSEVLARIAAHMNHAKHVSQARSALDAFGQATFVMSPANGQITWQTPLARQLLERYVAVDDFAVIRQWLEQRLSAGQDVEPQPLKFTHGPNRLVLTLSSLTGDGEPMISAREEAPGQLIDALIHTLKLTPREAEVLYWVIHGKTNRDIGDILGGSPRTVNKHLEHIFAKLGVETRTAAASVAMNRVGMTKT